MELNTLVAIIAVVVSICTLISGINLAVFTSINGKVNRLFSKYDEMIQRLVAVETKLDNCHYCNVKHEE